VLIQAARSEHPVIDPADMNALRDAVYPVD
jgi:hypothetical protein